MARVAMASHSAVLNRRTGNTFVPVSDGAIIAPREPIRLSTTISNQLFAAPTFTIKNAVGAEVFKATKTASPISGIATIDTAAPTQEGNYVLRVTAQSFPGLPLTHADELDFRVRASAPNPIPEPPSGGGIFGDIGQLLRIGTIFVVVVGGIVLITGFRR